MTAEGRPPRRDRREEERGLQGHAPIDEERQVERAILAQVWQPTMEVEFDDAIAELRALAESAGAEVLDTLVQRRRTPDRRSYFGRGRVEELKERCQELDATVVIVGDDLSPAQGRNLEAELSLRVVDRSQLIMDLFASRARTFQARMQVELAQLQYTLPRLRKLWSHLDRYKGGGVGMRGPGETQIEMDRREIRRKIADRRRRLMATEKHHQRQRDGREGMFTVGLLGYTSAGKSTLFNKLTDAGVLEEARPFSTLDTRTRAWKVTRGCEVLLSDTIGFIRDLPHHLIASFHATLAEAAEADLLLHVLDGARDDAADLKSAVEDVLHQIGVGDRPRRLVINKVDQVEDRALLGGLGTDAIHLSAKSGEGLDELRETVLAAQRGGHRRLHVRLPHKEGALLAAIEAHGSLLSLESGEHGLEVLALVPASLAGRLKPFVVRQPASIPGPGAADGEQGAAGERPWSDPVEERQE